MAPIKRKKSSNGSGKAQKFVNVARSHIESTAEKKQQLRKKMKVIQLQRKLDKKEHELRSFPSLPISVKSAARKGTKDPSEWKLKGAARPAKLIAEIEAGLRTSDGEHIKQAVATFDLFDQMEKSNDFTNHDQTKDYLRILKDLAEACYDAGMTDRSIKHFERCVELDKLNLFQSREGLICALIDKGKGENARILLESQLHQESAILAYSKVILEYVSWEVLEEDGSSEVSPMKEVVRDAFTNAFRLNPFIAVFLAAHKTFLQVVEYVDDIKEAPSGSIEEAFLYAYKNIGVWIDTVGACAWVQKELSKLSEPIANKKDALDEMYLGMYCTAVEMHKELVEIGDCDDDGYEKK